MTESQARPSTDGAHPLDRVVWNALDGKQRRLAIGDERARRLPPEIGPFAAIADTSASSFEALRALLDAHGPLSLVTSDELAVPPGFPVIRQATLLQMIWQGTTEPVTGYEYVELAQSDVPEMIALTTATQPGPFGPRTIELGTYIGARRQGRLAAMAGERMRLDGYTEISAVCVDPAFRGQGHASALMKTLIAAIRARSETPFLHVFTTNLNAISLYRTLGFVDRREMHLKVLGSAQA
ncbi:GNAT family N-acetyltransferase [Paraburkholderia bengalensis]|uniref:GNAT family N-acetyltransferase n=1 Tax=Paraburkholderia bengalensis TaxID=2747562 RepID=A0ABU8ISV3_9BURK